jgi:DNA-binding transcriptional regulator YhcF (GntR family)
MARKARHQTEFAAWAVAIGVSADEVKAAWQDLQRRGLVTIKRGQVTVSPLAMRRATSDA